MAVPFGLGKILDTIYASETDSLAAKEKLNDFCMILAGIFIIGGFANYGRVYLFNNACKYLYFKVIIISFQFQILFCIF